MSLGLFSIIEFVVLLINSVCILNEQRFLAKIGFSSIDKEYGAPHSMKSQVLNVIHSIRTVMRIPLIPINIALILLELIVG